MTVKSYAWHQRLQEEVADAASVDVLTPGFIGPENYKTDETEGVIENKVLSPQEAGFIWAGDFAKVTVANNSGAAWEPGQTLHVTVAGKTFDPANVQESFDALQTQVDGIESKISTLEGEMTSANNALSGISSQVSALQTQVSDLEARVSTLEAGTVSEATAAGRLKAKHGGQAPTSEGEPAEDDPQDAEQHGKHDKHKDKDKDRHKHK